MLAASSPASRGAHSRSPLRANSDGFAENASRVAVWRQDLAFTANSEAQQGLRELLHERECFADLQADLEGVKSLVHAASRLREGGARLADVVQCSAEAAGTRAEALAGVRDEFWDLCAMQREELQHEERAMALQREEADVKHTETLQLLGVYRDRLGLAIAREAPQTVRIAFTSIDRSDSEREFFFTLGFKAIEISCRSGLPGSKNDGYCIGECVPSVPELPKLLDELNANAMSTSALPRFVCSMRRAFFKQVVSVDEAC